MRLLSAAANHPRLELLLQLGMLPVFILSTMVPQATLLYWVGNSVFFLALQETLKQPKIARALGVPTAMLPVPRGPKEEKGEGGTVDSCQPSAIRHCVHGQDWEDGTVVVWHYGSDGAVSRMADVCCCSYCCLISVV